MIAAPAIEESNSRRLMFVPRPGRSLSYLFDSAAGRGIAAYSMQPWYRALGSASGQTATWTSISRTSVYPSKVGHSVPV